MKKSLRPLWFVVATGLLLLSISLFHYSTSNTASAATGIFHQINFQGKLVNPDGTNVTDGTYSIVFSLYTVSSGGSNIWTETQSSVALSNGLFQVNLGSVTALPGSVDFNTDNIYLGIKVGADAEMTPRIQFTAVPQAFNSEKLGGLDKTGFIQNTTTQQATSNFNISGAGVIGTTLTTPTLQSAAATALTITGNAASVWSTTAGTVTLQGFGGTTINTPDVSGAITNNVSITSGNVTSGAFASGSVSVDVGTSTGTTGTVSVGTAHASAVSIGKSGATTTVNGNLAIAANQNLTLSSGSGTFTQTSTATTGDIHQIIANSFAPVAAATGNGETITVTQAATNTSGTSTVNGVNTVATLNGTGAGGAKVLNEFNAGAATLTACTGAGSSCSVNGLNVATQSAGAAAIITQNAVNIQAVGIALGSLNGVNIGAITGGAGTENAINIGSGWDNIISNANFNVAGTGATSIKLDNTSALSVQNGLGNQIFGVDTTGKQFNFGVQSVATANTLNFYTSSTSNKTVLSVTTASGSDKTVTIPSETGTVCTTAAAGACSVAGSGYVQLAPASVQADSTANPSIFINKTATGNLIELQGGGSDVLAITKAGVATLTLTSNSGTKGLNIAVTDTATSGFAVGTVESLTTNPASNSSASSLAHGFGITPNAASTITYSSDYVALYAQVNWQGAGNVSTGQTIGIQGKTTTSAGSGAITNAIGVSAMNTLNSAVTNSYILRVSDNTGTTAPTNAYGLYVDNLASGTNKYPVYVASATANQPLVSVASTGATVFQNQTDSSTAFQVQDAAGVSLVNGDTSTTGTNLLTTANSGLESGIGSWVTHTGGTLTQNITPAFAYAGTASIKMVTTASTTQGTQIPVTLSANTTYTLSMEVLGGTASSTIFIGHQDTSGTDINCLTSQTIITTGWTRFNCSFTTGASVPSGQVYIYDSTTAHTFYVDEIQVVAGSSAYSYGGFSVAGTGSFASKLSVNNITPANEFNINTPYTAAANADVVLTNSAPGNANLVLEQAPNTSSNALQVQSSAGVIQAGITGTGRLFSATAADANTQLTVQTGATTTIGATLRGSSGQTANMLQIQDSLGSNLLTADAGGNQELLGSLDTPFGGFGTFNNLLTFSEQFDDATWVKTNVSAVTKDTVADPAGNTTAESLADSSAGGSVAQTSTTAPGGTYNFSVWLKTSSGTQAFTLRIDGATTGTGTAFSGTATTTWQRFSVTQNTTGFTGNIKTLIFPGGAASGTVSAWGAQLVSGSVPGVYQRSNLTGNTFNPSNGAGAVINGDLIVSYQPNNTTPGSTTAFVVSNSSAGLFTVDTSANHVTVGNTAAGNCLGNGTGRFCVNLSIAAGSSATSVNQNVSTTNASTAGNTVYGTDLTFKDTGTAANVDNTLYLDGTLGSNGNAVMNGITVNNPAQSGNLIDLQSAGTSVLTVTNKGSVNVGVHTFSKPSEAGVATYTDTANAGSYIISSGSTTAANATFNTTLNLTGLPTTDGTLLFVDVIANKATTAASTSHTTIFQIGGTTMATVTTAASAGTTQTQERSFIVMRINSVWRIMGQANTTPANASSSVLLADFAEWIPYSGTNQPQPGDVLTVGDTTTSVTDSTSAYNRGIVGVVSTSPYETGGVDDGHSVVLALTGRVPVKVSLENGVIHAGDSLTSSSTPGVAMKATHAGQIIGTALSDYDGSQSEATVMVQLHVGYDSPATDQTGLLQGDQSVQGNLTASGNINVGADLNVAGAATVHDLTVVGSVSIGVNLTVAGLTHIQDLQIDGHFITAGVAPTFAVLAAAGSRAAAATIDGDDTTGTITITTGDPSAPATINTAAVTGPSLGDLVKLTFSKPFGKAPHILVTPSDAASAALQVYPSGNSLTDFNLSIGAQPLPNHTYSFTYFVAQ